MEPIELGDIVRVISIATISFTVGSACRLNLQAKVWLNCMGGPKACMLD